jgi:KDO2-lipid IV(A) lauroyltransferase
MATLHLGNFDLVGQVLAARGYRLTVPVETMQPRELFDFLVAQRTSKGIRVVPVEHAARHMVRALKAHEVIGVACDRHIAGRTARVPMFGVPASLPLGPISLARRTGAPMLLGVGTRTGPGRFDGYIRPIPLSFGPDPDLDDQMNLRRLAAVMEEMIRLFPEQWLAFTPFWTDESAENGTDTMRHQSRAAV